MWRVSAILGMEAGEGRVAVRISPCRIERVRWGELEGRISLSLSHFFFPLSLLVYASRIPNSPITEPSFQTASI